MLGVDRRTARHIWTAALVLLLLVLVYLVRKTLFIFVIAILLAYLLTPLVNFLDRLFPAGRTRTPALALSYLIFVGGLILIGSAIGGQVIEQANALSRKLPEKIARLQLPQQEMPPGAAKPLPQQVLERIQSEVTRHSSDLLAALPQAGVRLLSMASDLIFVVIVPILAFFFLKDGYLIRQQILAVVEEGPTRAVLDDLLGDMHLLLAHYMRALVLLSLATFVAYAVAFGVMGVPYGVLLATVAMLLEFIPMLGPLAAGLAIVLVTAASGGSIVAVVVFLLAFRMLQDYVLSPYLMGSGVELHPLLVLFGVFAGGEVAGIAGTFLSVPVLALARIAYIRLRKARQARFAAGPAALQI
jgi:predicted PurR-regulated permease PerM